MHLLCGWGDVGGASLLRGGWGSWGCSLERRHLRGTSVRAQIPAIAPGAQMRYGIFQLKTRKKLFILGVEEPWKRLPGEGVEIPQSPGAAGRDGLGPGDFQPHPAWNSVPILHSILSDPAIGAVIWQIFSSSLTLLPRTWTIKSSFVIFPAFFFPHKIVLRSKIVAIMTKCSCSFYIKKKIKSLTIAGRGERGKNYISLQSGFGILTTDFPGEKLQGSYQMNFAIRVRDLSSDGENKF